MVVATVPTWLWPPLHGDGYQFWSGIGSDVGELSIAVSLLSLAWMLYRRHQCHADRCWRLAWHTHDDHGHPVCRVHHPHGGNRDHTIGGRPTLRMTKRRNQ